MRYREHTYESFDDLKEKNEKIWEEQLSRIGIETDDEDIMRTFYSCMYRFSLYPHKAYELDEQGNPIHYSPGKDCVISGYHYTEASAYQTSFAVQHDLEGLAKLHGGKEALLDKLDEFFNTPPVYLPGGYGNEIHEMTEMAAYDFGQCAISNQPSFHIPFIYAYFGENEKC